MMQLLAQANSSNGAPDAVVGVLALAFFVLYLAILVFVIVALWKVFAKAGQPGWACLIPIFNIYIMTKIAGRPWWWLLLLFIPIVGFVIAIILLIDIAKSFGKGVGFAIGLILLPIVFMPILGFGSAQYHGPAAA